MITPTTHLAGQQRGLRLHYIFDDFLQIMPVLLALLILKVIQHVFHYIDLLFADLISGRRPKTPTVDDVMPRQSRGPDIAYGGQPECFACADLSR